MSKTEDFKLWLRDVKGITPRSARDVESRTRRALCYINISVERFRSPQHCIEKLIQTAQFQECSMSVKSQLKRALFLFGEFTKSTIR